MCGAASPRNLVRSFGSNVSSAIGYTATAIVLALLLVAVGRPIATDDVWWHLALGRVFARDGPWLRDDPLLFAAPRPASSSSWLSDAAFAQVFEVLGFAGLRALHVVCAAAILALAGVLLRREAASSRVASLALTAFATLAAYRLFQLRPELATLFATLLLYPLVLRPRAGPTARRIALCAIGMALWANLHAGFLLGPILICAALIGVGSAALVAGTSPVDRLRVRRLLLCLAVGGIATVANPSGLSPHLAYFASGEQSPALAWVLDEWAPTDLFAWPVSGHPPSRADWLWVWALLVATLASSVSVIVHARSRAKSDSLPAAERPRGLDPALVALAWAALAAMVIAVRFLWLAIFPMLLLCQTWAAPGRAGPSATTTRWLPGLLGPALLASFVWIGPWPRISDVLRLSSQAYSQPYAAEKYPVDSIWLIRDAGLEGRLFTEYELGGYAGFWLAPKIKTYINGSLNSASDALDVCVAIRKRRAVAEGESFLELLDRLELDLFLGTGMPKGPQRSQGPHYMVAHLERTPGWLPIFRNATSALYLRTHARNTANLQRVADYYAREGIAFDPDRGFEPGRIARERPSWAIRHRLIPRNFATLERESLHDGSPAQRGALVASASFHALLGLYDAALEREARIRRIDPLAVDPRRRIIWGLLRAGRYEEARAEAASLDGVGQGDHLLRSTVELARSVSTLSQEVARSRISRLPLITPNQARALGNLLEPPLARVR